MELYRQSAAALSLLLRGGQVGAAQLVSALLARVEATESWVGALITLCTEQALAKAKRVDDARVRGERLPPLAGLPYIVKDNISVEGLPVTCASRAPDGAAAAQTASFCRRAEEAGLILLGKANLDEFAMGGAGENSALQTTRNPHALSRVPGGSSSGSAAALAAGQAPLALGTDTGGSARIPASYCGVVGLRPTYGTLSLTGVVPAAPSMDQIGPMARDTRDLVLLLGVIAGSDIAGGATGAAPASMDLRGGVKGLRIGLPTECRGAGSAPDVWEAVLSALRRYETLGARVEDVSLPLFGLELPAYYALFAAECAVCVPPLGAAEAFGSEVRRRIEAGRYVIAQSDELYRKAPALRRRIRQTYAEALQACDILVTPTTPTTAFEAGQNSALSHRPNLFTVGASLAGLPALSMPCGRDAQGMPIGLQLIGPPLSDYRLLNIAHALEPYTGLAGQVAAL
jgi:aspartyl-tRNA(Asn)/glutamyl-tRNA(Gln) amidotransferase subunit A